MNTNIIQFPPRNNGNPNEIPGLPGNMAEVRANLEAVRHVHINEVTEIIINTLVQQMVTGGFDIMDEEHQKDFAFLIEAIRSSICKASGIYHPFQDVSEKIMEECGDEPGVLIIADSINVKFQDESSPDADEPVLEAST